MVVWQPVAIWECKFLVFARDWLQVKGMTRPNFYSSTSLCPVNSTAWATFRLILWLHYDKTLTTVLYTWLYGSQHCDLHHCFLTYHLSDSPWVSDPFVVERQYDFDYAYICSKMCAGNSNVLFSGSSSRLWKQSAIIQDCECASIKWHKNENFSAHVTSLWPLLFSPCTVTEALPVNWLQLNSCQLPNKCVFVGYWPINALK